MDESQRATDASRWATAWAASGAAGLSGRPDGKPLPVPAALVEVVSSVGDGIAQRSERLGRRVDLDCLALLGERAAIAGLARHGDISCGGAARLLPTVDGHIAVSLARPSDVELLPAWLQTNGPSDPPDAWPWLTAAVREHSAAELVERATLLGIPCSAIGEVASGPVCSVERRSDGPAVAASKSLDEMLVVDLSSLWAGPLCANILGLAGMRVVKVESTRRPDGARHGPQGFFDLLHGGHESVALDFTSATDRAALRALIAHADVVIEASRPRALEQLGIDASATDGPSVWVSITSHGRAPGARDRVGFGDDAAAAGGLVTWDSGGPCFLADAVADPLTGLLAAMLTLGRLRRDGRCLIEVSLARSAAWCSTGPLLSVDASGVAEPRHRPVGTAAALSGRDTDSVLGGFGIAR